MGLSAFLGSAYQLDENSVDSYVCDLLVRLACQSLSLVPSVDGSDVPSLTLSIRTCLVCIDREIWYAFDLSFLLCGLKTTLYHKESAFTPAPGGLDLEFLGYFSSPT